MPAVWPQMSVWSCWPSMFRDGTLLCHLPFKFTVICLVFWFSTPIPAALIHTAPYSHASSEFPRVPQRSPHGLSPRRLLPREFCPARVSLGGGGSFFFPGGELHCLLIGNHFGSTYSLCWRFMVQVLTPRVTQIMDYMVNTWVNIAARFQRAEWIGTIFRTHRISWEESIMHSKLGVVILRNQVERLAQTSDSSIFYCPKWNGSRRRAWTYPA